MASYKSICDVGQKYRTEYDQKMQQYFCPWSQGNDTQPVPIGAPQWAERFQPQNSFQDPATAFYMLDSAYGSQQIGPMQAQFKTQENFCHTCNTPQSLFMNMKKASPTVVRENFCGNSGNMARYDNSSSVGGFAPHNESEYTTMNTEYFTQSCKGNPRKVSYPGVC